MTKIKYWLDNKNRITKTDKVWDNFVLDNEGGESAYSDKIVGQSLFKFISGDETRMFVESLMQKVRITNESYEVDYRCDSPDTKRFMKMNIVPLDKGSLRVENEMLREESFDRSVNFKLNTEEYIAKRCSMCNKVHYKDEWLEPDKLKLDICNIPIIHTVCKHCRL